MYNHPEGVIVGLHPHSPKLLEEQQAGLNDVSADGEWLSEPLKTTVKALEEHLPDSLSPTVGTFSFGGFGTEPVTTFRLVMENKQTVAPRENVSNADVLAFLEEFRNEPFLYYCHIRRQPTKLPEAYEYQVVVRIALFDPDYQLTTTADLKRLVEDGHPHDPTDVFSELGVASNISVFRETVGISPWDGQLLVRGDAPVETLEEIRPLLSGNQEYIELLRGRYGADDLYDHTCAYTSLMLRERDLGHFVGLGGVQPTVDMWQRVPGKTVMDLETLTQQPEYLEPKPLEVSIDSDPEEDDAIATATRSTANDGTARHWGIIKIAARTFREQGCNVYIPRENTESRPDLWIQTPSGEILAVEVESSTKSKAANLFTNVTRQAMWGYQTIVVMDPGLDDDGTPKSATTAVNWAVNKLAKPMKQLGETETLVHNTTSTITVDGATLLLPEGISEARWWLTWDNEYVLRHDGEVLARGPATAPLSEFEFNLPRLYTIEEAGEKTYVVEAADGARLHTYASADDLTRTKLKAPHRPVDLAHLQFVDSIYSYDDADHQLVHHEITAKWDSPQATERHERSHEDAFSTFTISKQGERIWEDECRPFIRQWIGSLSSFGPPAKNIYGEHRQDYTTRRANSTDTGKEKFYDNLTFRYDRGLIAPTTPGLETTPQFPEEFDVEPADVLKEPLIYGLEDRAMALNETPGEPESGDNPDPDADE